LPHCNSKRRGGGGKEHKGKSCERMQFHSLNFSFPEITCSSWHQKDASFIHMRERAAVREKVCWEAFFEHIISNSCSYGNFKCFYNGNVSSRTWKTTHFFLVRGKSTAVSIVYMCNRHYSVFLFHFLWIAVWGMFKKLSINFTILLKKINSI
jgi:hypothetical protein